MPLAGSNASVPPSEDLNWREPFLTFLRDNSLPQPVRSRRTGLMLLLLGGVVTGLVIILIMLLRPEEPPDTILHGSQVDRILQVQNEAAEVEREKNQTILLIAFIVLSMPASFLVQRLLSNRGRRTLAPDLWVELDRLPGKRPIVLLRSFTRDPSDSMWQAGDWLEKAVVDALRDFGPALAIGRPAEKLPPVGAARMYVSDVKWKSVVIETLATSQLVVLFADATKGFLWEVGAVVERVDPAKVLVCLPPELPAKRRQRAWAEFVAGTENLFPVPLPRDPDHAILLRFDDSWRPILQGRSSRFKAVKAVKAAVRACAASAA